MPRGGSDPDREDEFHTVPTHTVRRTIIPTTRPFAHLSHLHHNGRQHFWSTRQIRPSQACPPRYVTRKPALLSLKVPLKRAHFSLTNLPGEAAVGKSSVVLRFVRVFVRPERFRFVRLSAPPRCSRSRMSFSRTRSPQLAQLS